ncbi:MAG: ABC transporter permease subunit [Alphaproteobacteria bacterium]|nr:ABC transporter permease subunit [Alphaproteobacteria bacterium]
MSVSESAATPGAPWRIRFDSWSVGTVVLALILVSPVVAILGLAFLPTENIWPHLVSTVLGRYISNTLLLMLGVGAGIMFGGVCTAWVITMCRFPGRRFFEWALLIPMAMPAYVVAYAYTDLLEYAGPIQSVLRDIFGWSSARDYWFPDIRTIGGAIFMMSLVLYPYVYLLSRAGFLSQSMSVLEASRMLGYGPWRSFWKVSLPLARPAIAVGVALALMETLNDFGTTDYFAVQTFTVGIYNTWLGMNSLPGAAQLSAVLLAFVLVLIGIERAGRRHQRFHETAGRHMSLPSYELKGVRATAAIIICAMPLIFGFVVPAWILGGYAVANYETTLNNNFVALVQNSVLLSAGAAALALLIALFLNYGARLSGGAVVKVASRFASIGYAVPGAVLAVGVIMPIAWFDKTVDAVSTALFGVSTGLIVSGTIAALLFAYVVRFMAVSHGAIEAGLSRITPSMDDASRNLGATAAATLRRVHIPMIRGSALTAMLLVFVETMKELPMTLLLRPFNYNTLATFAYQYASDEQIEEAALAALAIVFAGLGPVILLSLAIRRSRPGHDPQ